MSGSTDSASNVPLRASLGRRGHRASPIRRLPWLSSMADGELTTNVQEIPSIKISVAGRRSNVEQFYSCGCQRRINGSQGFVFL
jgi:hypothetical protein